MRSDKTTLILQKGGTKYKLIKIIFGSDGSYYVTAPYHNQKKAFLGKATVDYRKHEQWISTDEIIEASVLDDDDLALKISHHPDGFLQFSGNGITSGRNVDGTPKGIGIYSWPLWKPVTGPSFTVAIKNYRDVAQSTRLDGEELCMNIETIVVNDDDTNTFVEGFFIPEQYERCIYRENNVEFISILHPTGIVLKLQVVRPATRKNFGFMGIHIYIRALNSKWADYEYIFSSSTENTVFDNEKRPLKGTGLIAIYPKPANQTLPSLNWPSR